MGKIDKYLGKWASRKLIVLTIAVILSCFDKLNDNLSHIMIAYVLTQGTVDAVQFVKSYFTK